MDLSENNFITNNHTEILVGENASFKNYTIQDNKSNGFFYKFVKSSLSKNSNYEDYIFSSGLKFNKIEIYKNIDFAIKEDATDIKIKYRNKIFRAF